MANLFSEDNPMQVWRWNAASDAFTTLHPLNDADLLSGVFAADGTPKTWKARPQVKPALEKIAKKQLPLGDISFIMGASVVLNDKAYAALKDFLAPWGQFLDLDLIDETGIGGGNQALHFYNVTNVIACIDFERSETDGKKVLKPVFLPGAVPAEAQVFKDPLRKKVDIYVNASAHERLTRIMSEAGLRGSTFTRIS
jgi:hypothetical protein